MSVICPSLASDPHPPAPGAVPPAVAQVARRATIGTILADAVYDSESAHLFAREKFNMRTIIPATRGRPTQKLPRGYWRRRMTTRFDTVKYGQRRQVETVNSMIKRMQGSALRSRCYWPQCREIVLRTITHNIMILHQTRPFLQSSPAHFSVVIRIKKRIWHVCQT